jgi:hypothetical protein
MKRSRIFLLAALLLALLPLAGEGRSRSEKRWSRTSPAVNETHLFFGEINKRGKPVGFHSRPGGRDPQSARLVRIVDRANRRGVYTAEVEIRNGDGHWLRKRSTFFPNDMDRAAVIAAVLSAYRSRTTGNADQFRGPSGKGFTIEGWLLDDGRINTAYPVYTRD